MAFLVSFHKVKKFIRAHGPDMLFGALIFSQMFANPFVALCFALSNYYFLEANNSPPLYQTGNLARVHRILQNFAAIMIIITSLMGLSLLVMPMPLILPALVTLQSWAVGLSALLGAGIAFYTGPIIRHRFYPDHQKVLDKLLKAEKHYNNFIKGIAKQNLPVDFDINAIKNEESLLSFAISKHNAVAVRELIQRGVQIEADIMINAVFNAKVVEGDPQFDDACQIMKILAERKVDIECKDIDGITLLEECINSNSFNSKPIANLLLNLGADLSNMSSGGQANVKIKLTDPMWRKIFVDHYQALTDEFPTRNLKQLAAKVAFSHFKDGNKVKGKSLEEILPQNLLLFYKNTPQREERYSYAKYPTFQFYKNNLILTEEEDNQFKRPLSLQGA